MLISAELKQVFKIGKTKLLLQLDQVASGLVFISIIFKNVELAKKTNIINDVYSCGPYTYAMTKFKLFYDSKIMVKNDKVIEFVCSSKKLHKYALMCYSYNQTVYGRTNDFVALWQDEYNSKPTGNEWKCLQAISTQYIKFIDELFPGIDTQFKILDKIVELVVSNVGYLKIRTIDGSVIIWKFYKTKRNIRKCFNPHNMVPENYALYTSLTDEKGLPLIDIKQYKVKFRSHLIHSIDAGVMRTIVNRMNDDFKYEVDQLHDCVLLHPEKVDCFYKIVENIYKDKSFEKYMNTHVFNEFKSIITSDNFESFDTLVEEFNSYMSKTFEINGDFKKIYKPEV